MTAFYEFVGAGGVRLRDDHDGQPVLLAPGQTDNGTGVVLHLTAENIEALFKLGVLRHDNLDPDVLISAFEEHVPDLGDLEHAPASAVMTALCADSPVAALRILQVLSDDD